MKEEAKEIALKMKRSFAGPVQCEPGVVKSVDEEKLTCVVTLLDQTEIMDVRLKAAVDEVTEGLVQIPAVGSSVLVALIGNKIENRFVMLYSNVVKVSFYGGENGGLVNWPDVKAELDKTNAVVNALVQSLTGWTPVPNDGGSALKIYATTQIGALQVGDFDDKEDLKVLH